MSRRGSKKKRKQGICVYCGKEKPLTREHVPQENLFKNCNPSELITVPVCADCNGQKKSVEDEYFTAMLALREDLRDHPEIKPVIESIERSLKNPKKERLIQ